MGTALSSLPQFLINTKFLHVKLIKGTIQNYLDFIIYLDLCIYMHRYIYYIHIYHSGYNIYGHNNMHFVSQKLCL